MWKLILQTAGVVLGLLAVLAALPIALRGLSLPLDEFLATPEVLFTWPVVVLVLGLVALVRFRAAIEHLVRHGRFTLPGGVEIHPQQPPETTGGTEPTGTTLTPEQQAQLASFIQELQAQSQAATSQLDQVQQLHRQALANSVLWEFKYLDMFLVPKTKLVLHWFSQATSMTRASFEAGWKSLITEEQQRSVILEVLLAHSLLAETEEQLYVTPKGRAFLGFMGMPPQPTPHPPGA